MTDSTALDDCMIEFITLVSVQEQCPWDHGGGLAFGTLREVQLRGSDPSPVQELWLRLARLSSQNKAERWKDAARTPLTRAPPSPHTAQRLGGGQGWQRRGLWGAMGWQERGGQSRCQDTHSHSQRHTSQSVQRGWLHHPLPHQPRRPGRGNYIQHFIYSLHVRNDVWGHDCVTASRIFNSQISL